MSFKSFLLIIFILASIAMKIQSNPTGNELANDLRSIKLAVNLLVYYNNLLEENVFNSQLEKKNVIHKLLMVKKKLSEFINKYKNNKHMISQALQAYKKGKTYQ
jgi:hypothetical protein